MSAKAEMLAGAELIEELGQDAREPHTAIPDVAGEWNPENYAREQIRGLVRRTFFSSTVQPVRQVVFSAAEPDGDVTDICDRVGQALALETSADIAIVARRQDDEKTVRRTHVVGDAAIKSRSIQIAANVWRVPELEVSDSGAESRCGRYWLSCLAELRNEFEYAVIQGPAAGRSSEAALLGELADGIILVLGAGSTRKAAARKIKNTLEASRSRILGTILRERSFPIPEQIYRRL